jgi:hypothetical protein
VNFSLGCPFFSSKNPGRFKKIVNLKKISEKFENFLKIYPGKVRNPGETRINPGDGQPNFSD